MITLSAGNVHMICGGVHIIFLTLARLLRFCYSTGLGLISTGVYLWLSSELSEVGSEYSGINFRAPPISPRGRPHYIIKLPLSECQFPLLGWVGNVIVCDCIQHCVLPLLLTRGHSSWQFMFLQIFNRANIGFWIQFSSGPPGKVNLWHYLTNRNWKCHFHQTQQHSAHLLLKQLEKYKE